RRGPGAPPASWLERPLVEPVQREGGEPGARRQRIDEQEFLRRMDIATARAHRVDHRHPAGGDVVAVADPAAVAPAYRLAEIGAGALDQLEQLLRLGVDRL